MSQRAWECTRCGYEVLGTKLQRGLKGAMLLHRNKDMSVHVSTWASYYFNVLTPVVALIRRVFLRLVVKMSDWFLEQRINIKFCVKECDTCALLSEAYGGETMKESKSF
jgi:hypothetical protein